MELKNKIILITGSAGTIGSVINKKLSKKNKIISVDRVKIKGKNINHYTCDLEDRIQRKKIFSKILMKYKKIDTLINCIGATSNNYLSSKIDNQFPKIWDKFIETNLTSIFHIITMCRKNLIKSEKPSIVNIASIHALTFPDWDLYKNTKVNNLISYSVSKGGLVNMSKWLATYLAPKIRVNTVSPGGIKKKQDQKFIKKYTHKTPLKRMCKPEDVLNCVEFLINDKSDYITGQNIILDGGYNLK